MKIRMLMTVMALAIVVGARAGQVGEKQARQKASAFMTGQATTRGEISMTRVYLPLQTKSTIWSVTDAPIYVFNYDGGGYVFLLRLYLIARQRQGVGVRQISPRR